MNVTVGYCNGGDAGHPVHDACYGTREGRGRREKGRAVAGGARGARGKNVGTWADARSAEAQGCADFLS